MARPRPPAALRHGAAGRADGDPGGLGRTRQDVIGKARRFVQLEGADPRCGGAGAAQEGASVHVGFVSRRVRVGWDEKKSEGDSGGKCSEEL